MDLTDNIMKIQEKIRSFFKIPLITDLDYNDDILTISFETGTVAQYIGSCTVWSKYPGMKRCSSGMDGYLYELYSYYKIHGNNLRYLEGAKVVKKGIYTVPEMGTPKEQLKETLFFLNEEIKSIEQHILELHESIANSSFLEYDIHDPYIMNALNSIKIQNVEIKKAIKILNDID